MYCSTGFTFKQTGKLCIHGEVSCKYALLPSTLALDFLLLFLSSKAPTCSPDSYPEFVSNTKLNFPTYSNYSSLCVNCVDSDNTELIFCSSYMVNFSKSYLFNLFWSAIRIDVAMRLEVVYDFTGNQ